MAPSSRRHFCRDARLSIRKICKTVESSTGSSPYATRSRYVEAQAVTSLKWMCELLPRYPASPLFPAPRAAHDRLEVTFNGSPPENIMGSFRACNQDGRIAFATWTNSISDRLTADA